jgi:hypothetical protein
VSVPDKCSWGVDRALCRFPERAGYVMIDGILDPVLWSSAFLGWEIVSIGSIHLAEPELTWHRTFFSSAEETYRFFLETCAEVSYFLNPSQRYHLGPPLPSPTQHLPYWS